MRLFVYSFESGTAMEVPASKHARAPFGSPDGATLGFFQQGRTMTVDAAGGLPSCLGLPRIERPVIAGDAGVGGEGWETSVFAGEDNTWSYIHFGEKTRHFQVACLRVHALLG